jgi:hypothetical protein
MYVKPYFRYIVIFIEVLRFIHQHVYLHLGVETLGDTHGMPIYNLMYSPPIYSWPANVYGTNCKKGVRSMMCVGIARRARCH